MIINFGKYSIHVYILLGGLVAAWTIQKILLTIIDNFFHRRCWLKQHENVSTHLETPLTALFVIFAESVSITNTDEINRPLLIGLTTWFLIRLTKVFTMIAYGRFDSSLPNNLVARKIKTRVLFIERTVDSVLVFIGIAFILMTFDEVRTLGRSLIASAGLAGIVLGFAAQKSLGTFVSGFQVAFTQPIRIDDVVVVEGEWGIIEEITLTYVVIKIWDLRRLIVPISYFTEKSFQNWTRTNANLLGYVFLNFDYSINIDKLRSKFLEILNASALWDKKVAVVQVTDATEKTLQVRFLMSARNSPEAFDLRCEVREKIISYVQKTAPQSLPVDRMEHHFVDNSLGSAVAVESRL